MLVWEPPVRLVLGWQVDASWRFDPGLVTEVELRFAARPGGGTTVTLEHRQLERLGSDAPRLREQLGGGWPTLLSRYAQLADTHS